MGGGDKEAGEQEVFGGVEKTIWGIFGDKIVDVAQGRVVNGFVQYVVSILNLIQWAIRSQCKDWGGGH